MMTTDLDIPFISDTVWVTYICKFFSVYVVCHFPFILLCTHPKIKYCLLFILTASPAEKTRLSTIKNNVYEFKEEAVYCSWNYFKMYVCKMISFPFAKCLNISE